MDCVIELWLTVELYCCVLIASGLDNKCTLYPLSLDEDPASKKRAIATHTSYLSCCKFVNSDHQVSYCFESVSRISGLDQVLLRLLFKHFRPKS